MLGVLATVIVLAKAAPIAPHDGVLFNDVHVHLTNYVQEGITARRLIELMGTKVWRATLFGIPLQQQWSYRVDGDDAPTYYLDSDSRLYYYSFTDAFIAMQYLSLPPEMRARLDPMITGFNPTDMYAADHIKRVLRTFPGVFSGIGEFTIHKEFVSAKISGDVASLTDPALDRILAVAEETGLLVLIHNDVTTPFPKEGAPPEHLEELKALFRRHPKAKIIWAHVGLGRVIQPVDRQAALVENILRDPTLGHVYFDISWSETAKYAVATPEATRRVADLIDRFPDRILFGTDVVAPADQQALLEVYELYGPLWALLTPEASEKVRKGNYVRLFDEARRKVRAWEAANVKAPAR
jgi:hypothetical protein